MKLSSNNSKRDYYIGLYNRSSNYTLHDVYRYPSQAKLNAYAACKRQCYEENGWGGKILSFNCQMFTFGYLTQDKITGEVILNVETHRNSYQMAY